MACGWWYDNYTVTIVIDFVSWDRPRYNRRMEQDDDELRVEVSHKQEFSANEEDREQAN